MMTMLRFPLDERKALEAVVLIAADWPGITTFYAAKILFLADKAHLNSFGRPVVGDRYIAMDNGPVPSAIYDWFKGNLERMGESRAIEEAVEFSRDGHHHSARARRAPDLSVFSRTDIDALRNAVAFCRGRSVGELSRITHRDPAWRMAALNAEMDPALMIEGEDREALVTAAEEFAVYGVA